MIYYIVAWLAFQCPGGPLKGLVPKFLCDKAPATALYSSQQDALDKLRELGPAAKLSVCEQVKGKLQCVPTEVRWEPLIQEK